MNILVILIPTALFLGLVALAGFFRALRHNQFDDPSGQAARIFSDRYDDRRPVRRSPARRASGRRTRAIRLDALRGGA